MALLLLVNRCRIPLFSCDAVGHGVQKEVVAMVGGRGRRRKRVLGATLGKATERAAGGGCRIDPVVLVNPSALLYHSQA